MNIAMARELARTKDFSSTRPWGNSVDMITLTEHFAARTHRTSHNVSYTLDVYSECSTATTLKLELRLIGGWRSTLGEAPPSIMAEERRGVPSWLLGFPVIQAPRVVRFLFFLETPFPVWELDLVASHLREMMSAAIAHDIPHKELATYVRSEESVKKFREVEAKLLKVQPKDQAPHEHDRLWQQRQRVGGSSQHATIDRHQGHSGDCQASHQSPLGRGR